MSGFLATSVGEQLVGAELGLAGALSTELRVALALLPDRVGDVDVGEAAADFALLQLLVDGRRQTVWNLRGRVIQAARAVTRR